LVNLKVREQAEDIGVYGKIMLKLILGKRWEVVDCNHLAQDRNQGQAFVNMVMNLRVP
jgi:hypothetical protein